MRFPHGIQQKGFSQENHEELRHKQHIKMCRSNLALYLIAIIVIIILGSCKEEMEADLYVFPEFIHFQENDTVKCFLVLEPAIKGEWNISSQPDWLIIQPSSGSFNGDTVELEISANIDLNLDNPGLGRVDFVSNTNGETTLITEIILDRTVKLNVEPEQVHFNENESEKSINLINVGRSFATWRFESETPWVKIEPGTGYTQIGQISEIPVTVSRVGLPVGTESGKALLIFNAEDGQKEIEITMDVPPVAVLEILTDTLQVGYFQDQKTFYLHNTGNVSTHVNIQTDAGYLTFSPSMMELQHNDSVAVTMIVDRNSFNTNVYNPEILFLNENGDDLLIPVKIYSYIEEKWIINGIVQDVVYNRTNDVLIMATKEPNELQKYNPETGTLQSLTLNLSPQNVSVDASGSYAVVSHGSSFSYINITTMQLEQEYQVSTPIGPIIFAPHQWVYAMPNDYKERIRCIYLPTGTETQHTGTYSSNSGITLVIHPSGNWLYRLISANTLEKLDITAGTAAYMRTSPTWGGYGFGRNIWISEEGDRIFASNRRIYRSSDDPQIDMNYNGIMQGEGEIVDLDNHSGINKTYAVFNHSDWPDSPVQNIIRKYDNSYMALEETFELPKFLIPDGEGHGYFTEAEAYFVFFNSSGSKLFLVARNSGEFFTWAVISMDVN